LRVSRDPGGDAVLEQGLVALAELVGVLVAQVAAAQVDRAPHGLDELMYSTTASWLILVRPSASKLRITTSAWPLWNATHLAARSSGVSVSEVTRPLRSPRVIRLRFEPMTRTR
jgi:hypothetical protein